MERRRIELNRRMHTLLCEILAHHQRHTGDIDTRKLLNICRAAKILCPESAPTSKAAPPSSSPSSPARAGSSATTAATPPMPNDGSTMHAIGSAADSPPAMRPSRSAARFALDDGERREWDERTEAAVRVARRFEYP